MNKLPFMSESGDMYMINEDVFKTETAAYNKAVNNGDVEEMMKFETGMTGWKLIDGD